MSNKYFGLLLAVACALPAAAQRHGDGQRPANDQAPAQTRTNAGAGERPVAERITNGPVVEATGDTWAVIAWTTNTGGSSVVKFGTSERNLTQTAQAPYADNDKTSAQNHRVRLQNLRPGTQYFYLVDSGQGEGTGTEARSSIGQFSTKGHGAAGNGERGERREAPVRIIDGPRVEGVGNNWATIAWTTNSASSSVVRFGMDRNRLDQMGQSPYADNDNARNQTHRVQLKNLRPNSTYYFIVDSGQGEDTGTEARSRVSEFKTK